MATTLILPAVGKVVGPGDHIMQLPASGRVRLSPGLHVHEQHVVSSKGGVLKQTRTGQMFLEGRQKRYIPAEGDVVVGTITDKHSENFVVDIGGPFQALLPQLSFEGATRRNRPQIAVGDLVHARVVLANKDQEPQLSCVDAAGKAGMFGHLKGGIVMDVSNSLSRQLLAVPTAPVLEALGSRVEYEAAVGLNGKVWVSASTCQGTVVLSHAIRESEFKTAAQVAAMVQRHLSLLPSS